MLRFTINTALVIACLDTFLSYTHVGAFIAAGYPGYALILCLALIIAQLLQPHKS
jgi:hypothetical protein